MKKCSKCKEVKSNSEFWKDLRKSSALCSKCKSCMKEAKKKYLKTLKGQQLQKEANERYKNKYPDKKTPYKKKWHLKHAYNLSSDEHYQMWVNQNGCCAVCNNPIDYDNLSTDHNHITGQIRGLLCKKCNLGLGYFYTDEHGTKLLEKATQYIKHYDKIINGR